jgi:hypothetical protein
MVSLPSDWNLIILQLFYIADALCIQDSEYSMPSLLDPTLLVNNDHKLLSVTT